jgi:hypothetical protein
VQLNIAFATDKLLRYASNPSQEHYKHFVRLLRYLRGTINLGVEYSPVKQCDHHHPDPHKMLGVVTGHVDADYAGCIDTRRSTAGFVFKVANGPIGWMSKLQTTVSLLTCEAEYTAACTAGKEAMWLV